MPSKTAPQAVSAPSDPSSDRKALGGAFGAAAAFMAFVGLAAAGGIGGAFWLVTHQQQPAQAPVIIVNNNVTTAQADPQYHQTITYDNEPSPFNSTPLHVVTFCVTDSVPCGKSTWTGTEIPYIFITYANASALDFSKAFHSMDLVLLNGVGTAFCGTTMHFENFVYQAGAPANGGKPVFEGSAVGSNNCGLHFYSSSDWSIHLCMELDGQKKPDQTVYGPGNKITVHQDPWDYCEDFVYHGGAP